MTDKDATQRAEGAKVAADVGSTSPPLKAYLVECLPGVNKQRVDTARSYRPLDTTHNVYGCERTPRRAVRTRLPHIRHHDVCDNKTRGGRSSASTMCQYNIAQLFRK